MARFRKGKFNRPTVARFVGCYTPGGWRVPKGMQQDPDQMSDKVRRNDNILWINGARVADKAALLREAEGKYPIRCQFYETGERYQLSSPYRHWTRTFESGESLSWALGDIEGPFTATFRPLYPKCPGTWPGENRYLHTPGLSEFSLFGSDPEEIEAEIERRRSRLWKD